MKTLRVLVCSHSIPAPDRDSGSQRLMDFIDFLLEDGWQVEFLATSSNGPVRARNLFQKGIPIHGPKAIAELATNGRFDLLLAAFWPVAEFVIPSFRQNSPSTRILVDSIDLHYLRDARRVLGGMDGNLLFGEEYGSQVVGELNSYAAADMVLAVSQKETVVLEDMFGQRTPVAWSPDCEELKISTLAFAERSGILTVGSYQHAPNLHALEYLCHEILPLLKNGILSDHPLYVVGNALEEHTQNLTIDSKNVRLVGWVPSVVAYYSRARISVVPLRYGAGTKRKLVQALMSGVPTVTTSIGAEGLNLEHEHHVLIADTANDFADCIERLIYDEDLWTNLSINGHKHILQTHSREVAKTRFLDAVTLVLRQCPKGSMLANEGWTRYRKRIEYQDYQRVINPIRQIISGISPAEAKVAIAGLGVTSLRQVEEHEVVHLVESPELEGEALELRGPALVAQLDEFRSDGVEFVIFPESSRWWLECFGDLQGYLDARCQIIPQSSKHLVYSLHHQREENEVRLEIKSSTIRGDESDISFEDSIVDNPVARLIAFYLPQFHPIPENDLWWGEGFTEWTNVSKAKPLFFDHYQPHLPTDLGYYDLRLAETRIEQAKLARKYGIHGFCYYHYWFHGKRLLDRPFNEIIASGEPDFPFCLCWANEPWSRRWDGRATDILQPQTYSDEDDLAHIRWLLPALADTRAIRIDGKPLLLIYQGRDMPDPARTIETWRREVEHAGLGELYLMAVETGWDAGWDATQVGFDAKVVFQPQFSLLGTVPQIPTEHSRLRVFDYEKAWPILSNSEPAPYPRYDCVFPSWDNSARKGEEGWVVHNSTPEAYENWLQLTIEKTVSERSPSERIVFINAWNEWAEGCHLEPDRRNGRAFLEATRSALLKVANVACCDLDGHLKLEFR